MGSGESEDCLHLLNSFFSVCKYFGIPSAKEKNDFPTTSLEFMGITLDTVADEFRLPDDKIYKIRQMLLIFIRRKKITLKEM